MRLGSAFLMSSWPLEKGRSGKASNTTILKSRQTNNRLAKRDGGDLVAISVIRGLPNLILEHPLIANEGANDENCVCLRLPMVRIF